MIASRWQVHDLARLTANRGFAQLVIEHDHGIMIGNVEPVIIPGEAGGRGQVLAFRQGKALFGDAISIAITQQDQLVRRFAMRSGALHQPLRNPAHETAARIGYRRIRLGHDNIAIRQGMDHARVVQTFSKALYFQPLSGDRRFARCPADRLGNRDGRNHFSARFGNHRVLARQLFDGVFRRRAPPDPIGESAEDQQEQGESGEQLTFGRHSHVILGDRLGGNQTLE